MPFPMFGQDYTDEDLRILGLALVFACEALERDPLNHPLAQRVALTVMIYFEQGERDAERLAAKAVLCELGQARAYPANPY